MESRIGGKTWTSNEFFKPRRVILAFDPDAARVPGEAVARNTQPATAACLKLARGWGSLTGRQARGWTKS